MNHLWRQNSIKRTLKIESFSPHADMYRVSDAIQGLYGITPENIAPDALENAVSNAVAGGMKVLQFRDKRPPNTAKAKMAIRLFSICRRGNVAFLVNDDLDLAREIGADGVHLGRNDASLESARKMLGAGKIIGVSCYNDLSRARRATSEGASYIAFGSFFSSPTKPHAVRANPALVSRVRQEIDVPIVAVGGITVENAPHLINAGVDAVAVISDLFGAADINARAHQYRMLFECHVR